MPDAEFGSSREELPHFDGAALTAKYALLAGAELGAEQANAWRRITAIVDRLRAAQRILISTPMWNLGIPYRLKHYIDLVAQPMRPEPARSVSSR